MHTFTALYDKQADAEAMQARLEELGIIDLDHDLHSQSSNGFDRHAYSDESNPAFWGKKGGVAPPKQDRHIYEEALRRGGYLLTVNCDDAEAPRVHQILEGSNAVDMVDRERELRASGFVPPVAAPVAATAAADEVIPVVEEQLVVGKRQVDRGNVRVRAYTVETPVQESVSLREERVDVERRAVNTQVADIDSLFQERALVLTETSEEVVVGKEARIVEELSVHKEAGQRVETVSDTVRHTEVEVDEISPKPTTRPQV
ncbi:YsnF/AvaK domain-containing protein [Caulobacter sp. S45]|uniref:YsnF/AvaK domain-containing protein n=1 Tax=Caulobacter sp. S45 TaxID=1641861 RepID=UPI001575F54E|nr:YsnF/AvaK domain-containing protein [Caulobacter sp. S45]